MDEYDLVIIGGGLVGGTLACALRGTGLRVCVVEAVPPRAANQPSYDERVIALAWGSRLILDGIGLWKSMAAEAEPIQRIHISDRGHFGFGRLDSRDHGVDALGYVVPARAMGVVIHDVLDAADGVDLLCPARVIGLRRRDEDVDLEVAVAGESRLIRTSLVVAADGGDSDIRRRLGLSVRERDYQHDAVITTVTPDRPQHHVAFERFTETGPLAMLPMTDGRYSVVWTARREQTAEILALSDAAFVARLQRRFGYRLGGLGHAAPRRAYPLRLLLTHETVHRRLVLIGNAAHTLHPVAGQGFNLGLRDVAALAEVVAGTAVQAGNIGSEQTLDAYKRWRGSDQQQAAAITDGLAHLFVNPWLPIRLARDAGLVGLDLIPGLGRLFARQFMGLKGRLPRLARGLPLEVGCG